MGETINRLGKGGQALVRYFKDIGEYDLLTPEQEVELAIKRNEGDEEALEKLTLANLRFVVSVAKGYQNQGLSLGDLINEGNLGLMRAAKMFDETRGFRFISYAVWWIRQRILLALAEQGKMVRLPLNRAGEVNTMAKNTSKLAQELGREPTDDDIAETTDMTSIQVRDVWQNGARHLSLDAPFKGGEENTFLHVLEDEESIQPDASSTQKSLGQEIEIALSSITPREAEVIRLYFGLNVEEPLTLEEIGKKFNLTRERIRQIKEKALARLRKSSRRKVLVEFLGQ